MSILLLPLDLAQLILDKAHQFMNICRAEVEPDSGGSVNLRDGFHVSQLQCIAVTLKACGWIVPEIAPHRDSAKLSHSVLDVIEWNFIQVQLLLPQIIPCRLKAFPTSYLIGKTFEYLIPRRTPVFKA